VPLGNLNDLTIDNVFVRIEDLNWLS